MHSYAILFSDNEEFICIHQRILAYAHTLTKRIRVQFHEAWYTIAKGWLSALIFHYYALIPDAFSRKSSFQNFIFDIRPARTIICPTLTVLPAHNIHTSFDAWQTRVCQTYRRHTSRDTSVVNVIFNIGVVRRFLFCSYYEGTSLLAPTLTSLTFFNKARSERSRGGFVWCVQLFAVREINFTSAWFREHWSNIKHIEHGCFQWIQTLELCEVWQWTDSEPLRCIIHVDLGCLTGKFPDSLIAIVWRQAMLSRGVERQRWLF